METVYAVTYGTIEAKQHRYVDHMAMNEGEAMQTQRWTSQDLDLLPDDGKRYEIIDGELYVSKQPHFHHQIVCGNVFALLRSWSELTQAGTPVFTPGVIFDEDDDVVLDVAWIAGSGSPLPCTKMGSCTLRPNWWSKC
jgi:hypothetical protein